MKLKSDMGPQGWVSHAAWEQPYGLHPLKPKVARGQAEGWWVLTQSHSPSTGIHSADTPAGPSQGGRKWIRVKEGPFSLKPPQARSTETSPLVLWVGSLRLPCTSGGTEGCVCVRCDPWAGGFSPEGDLLALLNMVAPSSQFLLDL